jgi:hypothetical protein
MPDTTAAERKTTRRRREVANGVIFGFLAVFALLLLYVVAQTYALLSTVRETQKSSRSAVLAIEDCTTPGRDCFDESAKRTGEAVSSINEVVLFAAYCADQPGATTPDAIEQCVLNQLARAEASPDQ